MKSKIWLSPPHIGRNEEAYILEALKSNYIAPSGKNIDFFENDIENYLGKHLNVVCLSSGTAAIHLALLQLGIKKEDDVLCQSFTFCASANPITYLGANPIFIDSESETWNMSPKFLEEAILDRLRIGKKPKAIICVHTYGMPAKIDEIIRISKNYEIPLIEDAAEALGSKYKDERCGTFGDFSILSFNGNKIITTSTGGALICKTKKEKEKTIYYSTQAKDDEMHYEHSEVGFNYRMSNILAGIGRGQMEVLNERVQKRQDNHLFYNSLFSDSKNLTLFNEPNKDFNSNHWLNCITINEDAGFTNYDIIHHLEKNNIESRPLWKPMHMQPVYNNAIFYGENISEKLFSKGLCLPSGSNITKDEKKRIAELLDKFI